MFDGPVTEECGYSYDHELPVAEFVDGLAVLECRRCGAELYIEEELALEDCE